MSTAKTLIKTDLPFNLINRGKVRDIYELDQYFLLCVATDRISAFDVVMAEGIPNKGRILTQMSVFWFNFIRDSKIKLVDHFISDYLSDFDLLDPELKSDLLGRSLVIRKYPVLPIEAIVRGYLSGSGWKDYHSSGKICGISLEPGLKESQQIPIGPIFTPSTKAEPGAHDQNISLPKAIDLVNDWLLLNKPDCSKTAAFLLAEMANLSVSLYRQAVKYADRRGIIIADTKFEFGLNLTDQLVLVDEVLTPDSSRFWPKEKYQLGFPQESFDKQYLRDWLNSTDWNKKSPPPNLAQEVIDNTAKKYAEALFLLTGQQI